MIQPMPQPRPPHLHRQITRHGKAVWYVRKGHGLRVRMRATFGTPEFDAEYQAAITSRGRLPPPNRDALAAESLAWLIARYRESATWQSLSIATRRQRENIFAHVIEKSGKAPFARITKAEIIAGRDRRIGTPDQARHFLDAMRGLFRWALTAQHVTPDPTDGVQNPKRKKGNGFPVWTEADAYMAHWPFGMKERVWFDVLCFTGLRRGDCAIVGKQHIRTIIDPETKEPTKIINLWLEKGGHQVEVTIPLLPVLEHTLEIGPTSDLAFVCGAKGNPFAKESFGNAFSEAARAAGVKKSAHGVRKIAATRAADNAPQFISSWPSVGGARPR